MVAWGAFGGRRGGGAGLKHVLACYMQLVKVSLSSVGANQPRPRGNPPFRSMYDSYVWGEFFFG